MHKLIVVFGAVREFATAAVLYPAAVAINNISFVSGAALSHRVERTVAKKAVKILEVVGLVAGKVLATVVNKKLVVHALNPLPVPVDCTSDLQNYFYSPCAITAAG